MLPIEHGLHQETIRQHVQATAERLEAQLGPEQFAYDGGSKREIEASPEPDAPITVGLDGGYIRGRERLPGANGCFEVIAGKSIPEEGAAKVFAFVHRIDRKPKRRLRAVLESQGILPHITFLCDGGDTVRELGAFVHPDPSTFWMVSCGECASSSSCRQHEGCKCQRRKSYSRHRARQTVSVAWKGDPRRRNLYNLLEDIADVREEQRKAGLPNSVVLKKLNRALDQRILGERAAISAGAVRRRKAIEYRLLKLSNSRKGPLVVFQ